MKFLLEQIRAAIRIANIFGGIATRGKMQTDSAALEFCLNSGNSLAMRMIKAFRDAQD